MTHTSLEGWLLIVGFIALTAAMAKPFGAWLFALYEGLAPRGLGWLGPVERLFYRAGGTNPASEQGWRGYAVAMLLFNLVGIVFLVRMIAAVRPAGIAANDIQTHGININQDYRYDQVNGRSQQRMVSYSASNSVRIKTRRLDRLSSLLDALTAAGADRINGPSFDVADPAPMRKEARRKALVRGAAEATEYAVNAGYERVGLLSVEEGTSSRSSDFVMVSARNTDALPTPPAPPPPATNADGGLIQPGQIETGIAVTLRYRMER